MSEKLAKVKAEIARQQMIAMWILTCIALLGLACYILPDKIRGDHLGLANFMQEARSLLILLLVLTNRNVQPFSPRPSKKILAMLMELDDEEILNGAQGSHKEFFEKELADRALRGESAAAYFASQLDRLDTDVIYRKMAEQEAVLQDLVNALSVPENRYQRTYKRLLIWSISCIVLTLILSTILIAVIDSLSTNLLAVLGAIGLVLMFGLLLLAPWVIQRRAFKPHWAEIKGILERLPDGVREIVLLGRRMSELNRWEKWIR
ncbi:MAG: hypothetical protein KDC26_04795 [Armatimonadetes bacterium]|nr:hypothetical protein [Armatimonadota bacterium]